MARLATCWIICGNIFRISCSSYGGSGAYCHFHENMRISEKKRDVIAFIFEFVNSPHRKLLHKPKLYAI